MCCFRNLAISLETTELFLSEEMSGLHSVISVFIEIKNSSNVDVLTVCFGQLVIDNYQNSFDWRKCQF